MHPSDEQETTLVFDPVDGKWLVYSCYRKHITKLLKVAGEPYWKEEEIGKNGNPRITAGKWKVNEKQIRFAQTPSPKVLTPEERQARRERISQMHKAKREQPV